MLGAAACIETDDDPVDDRTGDGRENPAGGSRGERITPTNPDGGATGTDASAADKTDAGDATKVGDADPGGGAMGSLPATAVPLAQCQSALPTTSVACDGPDLFEPNDDRVKAIVINGDEGCGFVPGKLSGKPDADWYRFTSPREDPVRVALAYEATPTSGSDLRFDVENAMGTIVASSSRRDALRWTAEDQFVAKKGFAYDVRIYDDGKGECQGYNLRIEPNFCTDAFEDNDSQSKAAQGLVYDTPLNGTVFQNDEDWYDASALQAAGAKCTITTNMTLNSSERVDFQFVGGNGSLRANGYLTALGGTNTLELDLQPGSGASVLHILSDKEVCTSYTVVCKAR